MQGQTDAFPAMTAAKRPGRRPSTASSLFEPASRKARRAGVGRRIESFANCGGGGMRVLAMRRRRADDRGRKKLALLSPRTAPVARSDSLLALLSEFIDANTDTVQLITGDQRTELEWCARCDYLRALQRPSGTRRLRTTTSAHQHRHSRSSLCRRSAPLSPKAGRPLSSSCAVPRVPPQALRPRPIALVVSAYSRASG